MEDRVCLTSENHPNLMIAMCGTFFNGITFAPLNPAYTESKVDRFSSIIFHPIILFGLDISNINPSQTKVTINQIRFLIYTTFQFPVIQFEAIRIFIHYFKNTLILNL